MKRAIQRKLREFYDRHNDRWGLDRVVGNLEDRLRPALSNRPFDAFSMEGDPLPAPILVATKTRGLLYMDRDGARQLLEGTGFYGVTRDSAGWWYAFHVTGLAGRVVRFRIESGRAVGTETVIWGLSRGVHQIETDGERLWVADTYRNQVLAYPLTTLGGRHYWKAHERCLRPAGDLPDGRRSDNYAHFNSIFFHDRTLHLLAHNETYKTGRRSELYRVDPVTGAVHELVEIEGSNCHNVALLPAGWAVCCSLEGTLRIDGEIVWDSDTFTRGLACDGEWLIVGGSDVQLKRELRGDTNGYVSVLDRQYQVRTHITIPNTQVQEIRLLENDLCMHSGPRSAAPGSREPGRG